MSGRDRPRIFLFHLLVRKWLGVRHATMEGEELIRRILVAEVELLWNGGVGTYIKSSLEKNADVGDRANDNVRVNAVQLKAKVIGEGGNLGLTQPARIEYAMLGARSILMRLITPQVLTPRTMKST